VRSPRSRGGGNFPVSGLSVQSVTMTGGSTFETGLDGAESTSGRNLGRGSGRRSVDLATRLTWLPPLSVRLDRDRRPSACSVTGPINLTPEGTFPFHTVTFRFYVQAGACHLPGVLNWTGTESNGKSYGSEFTYLSAPPVLTWRSPDGKFGVQQILNTSPAIHNVTLTVYE
jgi:hypothetical protein